LSPLDLPDRETKPIAAMQFAIKAFLQQNKICNQITNSHNNLLN